MTEQELASQLERAVQAGLPDALYPLVEALSASGSGEALLGSLLRFLESSGDLDLGTPGPLVHFLETFEGRGYEEALLASVSRRPTVHTLWMLNRLINGTGRDPVRREALALLERAATRADLEAGVREAAGEFVSFQRAGSEGDT